MPSAAILLQVFLLHNPSVSASDALTFSDSISRTISLPRSILDSEPISEALSRNLTFSRSISDTSSFSEALSRSLSLKQTINELFTFSETLSKISAFSRLISDGVTFSDSASGISSIGGTKASDFLTMTDTAFAAVVYQWMNDYPVTGLIDIIRNTQFQDSVRRGAASLIVNKWLTTQDALMWKNNFLNMLAPRAVPYWIKGLIEVYKLDSRQSFLQFLLDAGYTAPTEVTQINKE